MNGDSLELARMINELGINLSKQLGDVRADMQNFHGGMEARVGAIEKEQDDEKRKRWVHSIAVLSLNTLHHSLSNLFGWKI